MEESRYLYKTSCESCGSSDANAVYSNHKTWCFSCESFGTTDEYEESLIMEFDEVEDRETRGFKERGITKTVTGFYNVTSTVVDGVITEHWYAYKDGFKVRTVEGKIFKTVGNMKDPGLFGQSLFTGGKSIVVTEGELDAMAVAQAFQDSYNKIYPVVSVPGGAAAAKKAVLKSRDYLRGFDEVILWFDNDEAGNGAINDCAKIIGADKVKIIRSKSKDACDAYFAEDIVQLYWNAQPWQAPGIINAKDTWDEYTNDRDAVYVPWPTFLPMVNSKIFGRRLGSITMLTSGTGCGKTQFCREDIYHLLNNTTDSIGIVSLEESVSETVRGLISIELNKRVGLPDVATTLEQEKKAFDKLFNDGRVLLLDHQGSVSDASLVDKLEYLAAAGCKYIFLDHITIAVSDDGDNVNASIDRLMSDLLKICKRFDVWFGVISHLRKTSVGQQSFEDGGSISMDDLRGSGSLKQISAQIIALSRNQKADTEAERNEVKVAILKDRFTGGTGWAGTYKFDQITGRLEWTKPAGEFEVE